MKHENTASSSYSLAEWVAMVLGFPLLKATMVVPTQPIAKITNEVQKSAERSSNILSMIEAAKKVYYNNGVKGFFNGSSAAMTRELFKSFYKGYLQIQAQHISEQIELGNTDLNKITRGFAFGSIIGFMAPTLSSPFERYKTWAISQKSSPSFKRFMKETWHLSHNQPYQVRLQGLIHEFYRGLTSTIGKETAMNISFFIAKQYTEQALAEYKKDYPAGTTAATAILSGAAAATAGAPLDLIKTHSQKGIGKKVPIIPALKDVYKQHGSKGLFAGLPGKFMLITLGYAANSLFLTLFKELSSDKKPPSEPTSSKRVDDSSEKSIKTDETVIQDVSKSFLKQFSNMTLTSKLTTGVPSDPFSEARPFSRVMMS